MNLLRRTLAALACLLGAGLLHAAPQRLDADEARFLLTRTGFAPTEAEVAQVVGKSAAQAVDEMLAAARASRRVHAEPATTLPPRQMTREQQMEARREQREQEEQVRAWGLREMLEARSPLAERMALFWHGHFASRTVLAASMLQQQGIFRANGVGSFRTMLHAVARDPVMLDYLDGGRSRKQQPNENFAREVMELFTLGEATQAAQGMGGYTEQDIREAARAFTGWVAGPFRPDARFVKDFHDDGAKTLFGRTGNFDTAQALDVILEQPAAPRFITAKLWREFVSPSPDPKEVDRIGAALRSADWDLSVALRELLLSDAFWALENRGVLVKSPIELLVGALRQLQVPVADADLTRWGQFTTRLGQRLLAPPNVKGWPGYTAWIDTTTLLARKQFAVQVLRARDFDADRFLAPYGAHADREPDAAARERVTRALLVVPPTQPVAPGTVGMSLLKALMQDPAYQLK